MSEDVQFSEAQDEVEKDAEELAIMMEEETETALVTAAPVELPAISGDPAVVGKLNEHIHALQTMHIDTSLDTGVALHRVRDAVVKALHEIGHLLSGLP